MISCACLCLLSFLRVRIIPKMYTRAHARDLISTQHTLRMYSSHTLHASRTHTHTIITQKKPSLTRRRMPSAARTLRRRMTAARP